MTAIITKFLPATDTKGSRIKATYSNKSITVPYRHELSAVENHKKAAIAFVKKIGLLFDEDNEKFYGGEIGMKAEMAWVWAYPHQSTCYEISKEEINE